MKQYIIYIFLLLIIIQGTSCRENNNININKVVDAVWDKIEVTGLDFSYKKNTAIKTDIIKNILRNLDNKPQEVSKGFYINIKILIKGKKNPVSFLISASGWGITPQKGDCYTYKDNKLGEKLYYEVLNKITNWK